MSTVSHKSHKPQKAKKYRAVGSTSIAPAPLPTPYLTPQSTTSGSEYSKFASSDYEPIPNPSDYASALQAYSNSSLKKTVVYNNAKVVQYSKILHQNTIATDNGNNNEEIYSDPGHCETDIYDYFKKKKFHIIKKDSIRFVSWLYMLTVYIAIKINTACMHIFICIAV